MAAARLAALFLGVIESFKSLLAPQGFGAEYELLSAELSAQLLRLDLWADAVGLSIPGASASRSPSSLLDRPDFNESVTQVVEGIAFLLSELKDLRGKYILKAAPLLDENATDEKPVQTSRSRNTFLPTGPHKSLAIRARQNQRQQSVYALAKWTIFDERRFGKRVKRLGSLISGLEDVARAAGLSPSDQVQTASLFPEGQIDSPPPYSMLAHTSARPSQWIRTRGSENTSGVLQHLLVMERYLAGFPSVEAYPIPRARDKLLGLSEHQLTELRIDVYDELLRRQDYDPLDPPHLRRSCSFSPDRNGARQKLSTLVPLRFGHLVEDLVYELRRRSPHLEGIPSPDIPATPPQLTRHSSGCTPSSDTSPPSLLQFREPHRSTLIDPTAPASPHEAAAPPYLLQYRKSHRATLIALTGDDDTSLPSPVSSRSQSPATLDALDEDVSSISELETEDEAEPSSERNSYKDVDIFKSLRVNMNDPCYKVLPAALRKYGINAQWQNYSLYLMYEEEEVRLGMDEKPLLLFKRLDREGKKPMFMLRRTGGTGNEDGNPSPPHDSSWASID